MILFGCMQNIFRKYKNPGMENQNDELQALCPKRLAIYSIEMVERGFDGNVAVEITT